jgi:PPK2 family polyphosphate:nucleotide phosphotransferase
MNTERQSVIVPQPMRSEPPVTEYVQSACAACIGHREETLVEISKQQLKLVRSITKPFRVTRGDRFRLKHFDAGDTLHFGTEDKPRAQEALKKGVQYLAAFQDKLYAQDRWSVLLIFQAMDAAGKDGAIKHVLSGVNPQGCQVTSFKAPSPEELDHDYLWRCMKALPERGRIGIFNRSYYEEVLVVRVHERLLAAQKLPPELVTKKIWKQRFADIRNVERYLARNGTLILKFFLNLSKDEQKKRFLERLDDPDKNWKFSVADARERTHWDEYMAAYEDMIRNTASDHAPWFVVPADSKWFTRAVVAAAIIEGLASLGLAYPRVGDAKRAELIEARAALMEEARAAPASRRGGSKGKNRRA